jgi:hypothetical protein
MVALANALLEVETMDRETFENIMNKSYGASANGRSDSVETAVDLEVKETSSD